MEMTKIDIVSGFLGAGKTTLIKKLLKEALAGEQVVLIENEFGEIGIDGGFLKEAGIEITEMNSGCICCSLVGDFATALKEVLLKYKPDRILIEPSGVGKLSDVMRAVEGATADEGIHLNSAVAVVDAKKCKSYLKNFGEFFENQIEHAGTIILSRTGEMDDEKVKAVIELIRQHNDRAVIVTTPWENVDGKKILETIENAKDLEKELMKEVLEKYAGEDEHEHHHHHHHDHDHDHDHDEHDHDHEHEHHHEYDENGVCSCGHHHHDHDHHHHHADEVFDSIGIETNTHYTKEKLEEILKSLDDEERFGNVLRAKGMLPTDGDRFLHFDYVPEEFEVREGASEVTGKICVIGAGIKEEEVKKLFS